MNRRDVLWTGAAAATLLGGIGALWRTGSPEPARAATESFEVTKTDAEWKKLLTPEQYAKFQKHQGEEFKSKS